LGRGAGEDGAMIPRRVEQGSALAEVAADRERSFGKVGQFNPAIERGVATYPERVAHGGHAEQGRSGSREIAVNGQFLAIQRELAGPLDLQRIGGCCPAEYCVASDGEVRIVVAEGEVRMLRRDGLGPGGLVEDVVVRGDVAVPRREIRTEDQG